MRKQRKGLPLRFSAGFTPSENNINETFMKDQIIKRKTCSVALS